MSYSPTEYTQHKIEYKEWANDDHADKVHPRPTVPLGIIDLFITTSHNCTLVNMEVPKNREKT